MSYGDIRSMSERELLVEILKEMSKQTSLLEEMKEILMNIEAK
jgi:hypothetical protein